MRELAKQGRHIECGCEGGRVDGAARTMPLSTARRSTRCPLRRCRCQVPHCRSCPRGRCRSFGGRATRFATLAAPGSSLMIVVALAVRPAHLRGRTAAGAALASAERLGRSFLSSGRAVDLRPSEQVVGMLEWVVPVRSRPAAAPGVLSAARGKSSLPEDSCQIRRPSELCGLEVIFGAARRAAALHGPGRS